ncbi:hypothetical protein HWV62_45731 [Athelia sp. TMB]|nr:hypothetical protein HWV62_45731 [Athelia sp. TMB]
MTNNTTDLEIFSDNSSELYHSDDSISTSKGNKYNNQIHLFKKFGYPEGFEWMARSSDDFFQDSNVPFQRYVQEARADKSGAEIFGASDENVSGRRF